MHLLQKSALPLWAYKQNAFQGDGKFCEYLTASDSQQFCSDAE
jgi:hypothetical protein